MNARRSSGEGNERALPSTLAVRVVVLLAPLVLVYACGDAHSTPEAGRPAASPLATSASALPWVGGGREAEIDAEAACCSGGPDGGTDPTGNECTNQVDAGAGFVNGRRVYATR